jgi:hypothetical protein
MKRVIAVCSLFVLAGIAVCIQPRGQKVKADNPLTLNPVLYSCIKDNGVVSRTTSYDPQNGSNCDMIVSDGVTQTLVWKQAPPKAFSGSILNWAPQDGNTYAMALSGINQQPEGVTSNNGVGSGTNVTTLKQPYSLVHFTVVFDPPFPAGVNASVNIADTNLTQASCGSGCTTNPGNINFQPGDSSKTVVMNPAVFFAQGDQLSVSISTAMNVPFTFTSVSWTVQ